MIIINNIYDIIPINIKGFLHMISIKVQNDIHSALKREAERREQSLQSLIDEVLAKFLRNETHELKDL